MLFGRLTERAQRVLALAQEEAIRLNHSNIGTEHLLLGLMKEPEAVSYTNLTLPTKRKL